MGLLIGAAGMGNPVPGCAGEAGGVGRWQWVELGTDREQTGPRADAGLCLQLKMLGNKTEKILTKMCM